METYFNLGSYSRPITTSSSEAQVWFDRGLNWCYGFHHKEALRCFKKVIEFDAECAMGYWGIAYATGPYYNIPWLRMSEAALENALVVTFKNTLKAQSLSSNASAVEKALCHAFSSRFPAPHIDPDLDPEDVFAQRDDAYANAMRKVYADFPHDNDVCALTAEALMCRTPWMLWDLENRIPAKGTDTTEAIAIVESAFDRIEKTNDKSHPGLLHFYIHIMEMSPEPEKALSASDCLRTLVPDAGHLIHMPSHIYVLCGQYEKVVSSNIEAVVADDKYLAVDNSLGFFTIYRLHNIHFQIYGAIFLGQYEPALRATKLIEATVTPEALHHDSKFLSNYVEGHYGMKAHVYVRFGKWEEIIAEPLPNDPELYCLSTAFWLYAKGIAFAVLGDIENAHEHREQFHEAFDQVPAERLVYRNESRDILAVASAMLDGELEYRQKNYDDAFKHLRHSVYLYDTLNYSEPWAWMQPPRHALGALLLEQGHVEEAAQIYRADLGLDDTLVRPSQHPNNIWSLHGYAECCERLGHIEELATIQPLLKEAQALADIPVNASCFCRKLEPCCD